MKLTIKKGADLIFETTGKEADLRRIADEWYIGRSFAKEMRGRRARKPLSLERLSKMYDPDGYLKVIAMQIMQDTPRFQMSTDDPCGGRPIDFLIEP